MTNAPSKTLNDLMYAYYSGGGSSVITGPVDGNGNVKVSQQGSVDNARTVNRYGSISNSNKATAPTAGTAIATVAVFDAYYEVDIIVGFGGTAESTAIDNFQLKHGSTVVATLPVANAANTQSQMYRFYVNPGSDTDLTVSAISNASASSVYKATIIITRQV